MNAVMVGRIWSESWWSLRSRRVATGIALVMALRSPRTLAQPNPEAGPATPDSSSAAGPATTESVAGARTAFQEGVALAKAGRWAFAIEALERSDALHPHAITAYNIGYCELQLGHSTRARKMLARALADHRARGEVELPVELMTAAQTYLGDADRQIARVTVTITRGAVTVDGRPLELVESDGSRPVLLAGTRAVGQAEAPPSVTFEVLVDPGAHAFALSMRGRADVIKNETLAPGSQISMDLRAPDDAIESSKQFVRPHEAEELATHEPSRAPMFIAFGVGAAAMTVGTVSGIVAFGKKSEVNQACRGGDPARCAGERESGNRAADISTVSFIGGGVAVVVAAVLFFVAPESTPSRISKSPATTADVHPILGWGALGLEGCF